jgi:hypothetical protein
MSEPQPSRRYSRTLSAITIAMAMMMCPHSALGDPAGQDTSFSAANSDWNGHSEWAELVRRVLGPSRVRFVATLDYQRLRPEDGIIVFHPENPLHADSLARFMNAGGRVAIFDDFGQGSSLWRRFAIHEGDGPDRPAHMLQRNPALAIARPHVTKGPDGRGGRHPIVSDADDVVTNHPIVLNHPELTRLLEFDTETGPKTLALTGVIEGKGRLLACGDSSVFVNLMLRYPGNRAFAEGVARYLMEREPPESQGTLFVVAADFEETGEFGNQRWEDTVREHVNTALNELAKAFHGGVPLAACTALSLATIVGLWLRARARGTFARTRIVHSFSGERARASDSSGNPRYDLMAAPTTTSLVALGELARAYEAFLGGAAHANGPLSPEDIESALDGCSVEQRGQYRHLYTELCAWRRELTQKKRRDPTPSELVSLHQRTMEAVDSLTSLRKKEASDTYGQRHA